MSPRVGIVGARRVRQGLGPFVARYLREAGLDVVAHADVLQVDIENLLAASHVGAIDQHVAIESARAEQGWIERFGAVGGAHDDYAAVASKAIHFHKQGIKCLLAFIVSAA